MWADSYWMKVNTEKTEVMYFGRNMKENNISILKSGAGSERPGDKGAQVNENTSVAERMGN